MADKKRRCSKGPKNELHNGKERRHSLLPDGTLHPTPFRPPCGAATDAKPTAKEVPTPARPADWLPKRHTFLWQKENRSLQLDDR